MVEVGMEVVIDYEFLRGRQTFLFKSPYKMAEHSSSENGLNWADGHID